MMPRWFGEKHGSKAGLTPIARAGHLPAHRPPGFSHVLMPPGSYSGVRRHDTIIHVQSGRSFQGKRTIFILGGGDLFRCACSDRHRRRPAPFAQTRHRYPWSWNRSKKGVNRPWAARERRHRMQARPSERMTGTERSGEWRSSVVGECSTTPHHNK